MVDCVSFVSASEDLVRRQKENELEAISGGVLRYRERVRKAEAAGRASETRPNTWLMQEFIPPVARWLRREVKRGIRGKSGIGASQWSRALDRLNINVCVFVGLKIIQNTLFENPAMSRTALADRIGREIADELQFNHMKKEDSRTYRYWMRQAQRSTVPRTRARCLRKLKQNYDNLPALDKAGRLACGHLIIQAILEKSYIIENFMDGEATRNAKPTECVRITHRYRSRIGGIHKQIESLWPYYEPMVCPPKPWDSAVGCGFVGELGRRTKLVRTGSRRCLDEISRHLPKMPQVLSALNAIQATPFRINQPLLNVLSAAVEAKGGKAFALPLLEEIPYPKKPEGTKTDRALLINYVSELKQVQEQNDKNKAKAFSTLLIHNLALKYKDEAAIWFAHNLDWRGRVYPMATCLSPQGDDLSRAMLEFANGMPLGTDEAVEWLAIHGAGCWGYDKVAFEERVQWVREHEREIRATVEDPLECRWWADADKPWMFLAWCFEWIGYLREGKAFVSRLAVAMDGSCNGLQNFAAMMRHEETARAVNLLPSDKPNDIYQQVADKVKARLEALAASTPRTSEDLMAELDRRAVREYDVEEGVDDEHRRISTAMWDVVLARWLLDAVSRSLVKRPVMTYPYSVTLFGMMDQLLLVLTELHEDGKLQVPAKHIRKAAHMLRSRVFDAVSETVVAAAEAMEWLKDAAKAVVSSDDPKPVEWVSPIGMLVIQDYRKQMSKRLDCKIGGIRLQPRINVPTEEIDARKQAAGVAPNFVHSCDASHLMFTVNACVLEGISDFQMIHDSYGTHACNAASLARVLREQFVKMYGEHNLLAEFQTQLAQIAGSEAALLIPDAPSMGTLDLKQVMKSKYFFA